MALNRQHLIDPAVCIRCNTCEETCPLDAITHDATNYVVDYDKCKGCMDCISPCPTGAIDSWQTVATPWTLDDQYSWDDLPDEPEGLEAEEGAPDEEAEELRDKAEAAQGGKVPPPFSAAHPYVSLYSKDNPATARIAGNFRITGSGAGSDIHHIVLDFGKAAFPVLEGQCIGIIPPGTDDKGNPHLMRLYSVASPRDGERPGHNNLALTVKRVREEDGMKGLASNYLCDLAKNETVQVVGPFGDSFLMPNHPSANIVMICTGTGAAPMRAITERRRREMPKAPGKLMLFFGARTPDELPYFGPLQKLPKDFIDTELAYSRLADKPKEYVQDRMKTRGEDLANLLQSEDTFIYVCGLKGMEKGCEEAFEEICAKSGLNWEALRKIMKNQGRYHVETY